MLKGLQDTFLLLFEIPQRSKSGYYLFIYLKILPFHYFILTKMCNITIIPVTKPPSISLKLTLSCPFASNRSRTYIGEQPEPSGEAAGAGAKRKSKA